MDKINVALEILRLGNFITDYELTRQAEKVVLEYLKGDK